MALDAGLHYLTLGYIERTKPEYFVDDESSGVTWQPDVYPEVLALAREHGRDADLAAHPPRWATPDQLLALSRSYRLQTDKKRRLAASQRRTVRTDHTRTEASA